MRDTLRRLIMCFPHQNERDDKGYCASAAINIGYHSLHYTLHYSSQSETPPSVRTCVKFCGEASSFAADEKYSTTGITAEGARSNDLAEEELPPWLALALAYALTY